MEQSLFNRFSSDDATNNQLFTRATTTLYGGLNVEGTATYTRTFEQTRKEWSVLGQYARTAALQVRKLTFIGLRAEGAVGDTL